MKKFFKLDKGTYLEFGIATLLMIINIVLGNETAPQPDEA